MKVTEHLSVFQLIRHCSQCPWFERPSLYPPRAVCPMCGGDVQSSLGRFMVREKQRWFGTDTEVTGVLWHEPIKPFEQPQGISDDN